MRTVELQVAETVTELVALPVGSRILTATHAIMELDIIEEGRKDSGATYWISPETLRPFPRPPKSWLPAFILPTRVGE